jgi:hypothetical protein
MAARKAASFPGAPCRQGRWHDASNGAVTVDIG